jgi:hypothetical protein
MFLVCLPTAVNLEDAGFFRSKSEVLHKNNAILSNVTYPL